MATILVDYENMSAEYGCLKGANSLTEKDTLYIFFSASCSKMRAEYIQEIEESRCRVKYYRLKKAGKNALDFYIAAECGALCKEGETQIIILSKDKGYLAVIDFLSLKEETKNAKVVLACNIEKGLLMLNAPEDAKRRERLNKKHEMLDIETEFSRIMECRKAECENMAKPKPVNGLSKVQIFNELLHKEGFHNQAKQAVDIFKKTAGKTNSDKYNKYRKAFGQKKGSAIYKLDKSIK